jgi:hypothetical protein
MESENEISVILAEYKARNDEIFKAMSFRIQFVVGYLGVLSALATWSMKDGIAGHLVEAMIALIYFSLALIYLLFLYSFTMVSNTCYIRDKLKKRIDDLLTNNEICLWESFNPEFRKGTGGMIIWLTKFHVELVPYTVVLFAFFIGILELCQNVPGKLFGIAMQNSNCMTVFGCILLLFSIPISILFLIASKKISDQLKSTHK